MLSGINFELLELAPVWPIEQVMKLLLLFSILFLVNACSRYEVGVETLGFSSDFDDVTIPDDFEAPEDEGSSGDLSGGGVSLPTNPVSLKNTFFIEDQSFSLARGSALRWDGCKMTPTQGGYNSDSQCGRAYFHPNFADNLNEAFYVCVNDAAKAAGLPEPQQVFVRHIGSYNDRTARNSSRLSNHAYARAWDIVNFNLYDREGKHYKISTYLRDYKDEAAVFYDEFRDCWQESLPSSCRPGNTEYQGSVGHQASKLGGNSLHNDHLHLSYPLCAG